MDIICYSHLRWSFVYQRPQHLLSRLANYYRVFFVEEPIYDADSAHIDTKQNSGNAWIIVPHLPAGLEQAEVNNTIKRLLKDLWLFFNVKETIAWYYTPMALEYSDPTQSEAVIYDCMDELSAFKNAPPALRQNEKKLFQVADIVFTGGYSLYQAKKHEHDNIHLFPSSIDFKHFEKARGLHPELYDQENIPKPRIGFFGVVDERMNIGLLDELAAAKPDWHFVIVGPVVKIERESLPAYSNIHYLGQKTYKELPWYISGWDAAIMPFAINESTRYISPTKTPEYLAAGKPVISTPVHDVVKAYGSNGLVTIAENTQQFIKGIQQALNMKDKKAWLKMVDTELEKNSWDLTCENMIHIINKQLEMEIPNTKQKESEYV